MAADHAAEAGTAVPAAANLALDKQVAVFVADGDATAAAITLVAGTKRAGEPGGGGARVGIGNANGLHWIRKKEAGKGIKGGVMTWDQKIFLINCPNFLSNTVTGSFSGLVGPGSGPGSGQLSWCIHCIEYGEVLIESVFFCCFLHQICWGERHSRP